MLAWRDGARERLKRLIPRRNEDAAPPPWLRRLRIGLAVALPFVVVIGLLLVVGSWQDREWYDHEAWVVSRGGNCGITRRETRLDRAIYRVWPSWQPPRYIYRLSLPNADGNALREVLRNYPDVQFLELKDPTLTDADVAVLGRFSELLTLEIDGGMVPVSQVAALLPKLKVNQFGLSHLPVSVDDMKVICGVTRLESLRLVDAGLTPAHLAGIGALTNLRTLYLGGNPLTDAAIPLLPRTTSVGADANYLVLELNYTGLTDAGVPGLPKATSLDLTGNPITDAGLVRLPGRDSCVDRLDLSKTRVTGSGLAALAGQAGSGSVSELHLDGLQLSPAAFKALAMMPDLMYLTLDETNTTDRDLVVLAGCPMLWRLSLNGTRVTDAGCRALAAFPRLHEISLNDTGVTDAALRQLTKEFGELSLARTHVTGSGLVLASLSTSGLSLQGCKLTDSALRTLMSEGDFGWLDLAYTSLDDQQLDLIKPERPPPAIVLKLQGTRVTAAGLRRLVERFRDAGKGGRGGLPTILVAPGQLTADEVRELLPELRISVEMAH